MSTRARPHSLPVTSRPSVALLWRYGTTIFIGAFLLFQVQPLLGQALLPRFGGTYTVWTVCLVFFQTLLLAGYAYAHLVSRLPPRRQALVHGIVVLLSLAFLPITTFKLDRLGGPPSLQILQTLSVQVGLPYLILASTGPLLQSWFHRETNAAPYRFYALSNAASLLGLGTYPFVVQPLLGMKTQDAFWSASYGIFVLLFFIASVVLFRRGDRDETTAREEAVSPLRKSDLAFWIGLPAAGSMLLLGISNEVTSNLGAVPFLWVLPLGLYLITFILAFERPEWYSRKVFLTAFVVCLLANTSLIDYFNLRWVTLLPVASATLFVGAWMCHGELVRMRPHPQHLTAFYLCIAAGGALGGILVGVVAPLVFSGYWEVPLGLIVALVLVLAAARRDPESSLRPGRAGWKWPAWMTAALAMSLGLCAVPVLILQSVDAEIRNFYGVLHVVSWETDNPLDARRILMHGSTIHGVQFKDPVRSRQPTTYFGPGSGVGIAIEEHPHRLAGERLRIGVVGLGIGTIAAWGRPGDVVRYYEINPAVITAAHSRFRFLAQSAAKVEIVLGDGRLALEHDPPDSTRFDVLALDAFAGGTIPAHLLTRESFELYRNTLEPGGIIAVHVSNEFLRLAPAVRAAAEAVGLEAVQLSQEAEPELGLDANEWVLATQNAEFLNRIRSRVKPWDTNDAPVLLTDQKMSLMKLLGSS